MKLPNVEVYMVQARTGKERKPCCDVYLIKYNGQIHEGGWANKEMAYDYAEKLLTGKVTPKLLPINVER